MKYDPSRHEAGYNGLLPPLGYDFHITYPKISYIEQKSKNEIQQDDSSIRFLYLKSKFNFLTGLFDLDCNQYIDFSKYYERCEFEELINNELFYLKVSNRNIYLYTNNENQKTYFILNGLSYSCKLFYEYDDVKNYRKYLSSRAGIYVDYFDDHDCLENYYNNLLFEQSVDFICNNYDRCVFMEVTDKNSTVVLLFFIDKNQLYYYGSFIVVKKLFTFGNLISVAPENC